MGRDEAVRSDGRRLCVPGVVLLRSGPEYIFLLLYGAGSGVTNYIIPFLTDMGRTKAIVSPSIDL